MKVQMKIKIKIKNSCFNLELKKKKKFKTLYLAKKFHLMKLINIKNNTFKH